jgi:hypothetical protein
VDRLVDKFLAEVNWCLDAVHERTFRNQYNEFWARRFGFDDLAGVDLRWLALLFIILAFSGLIDAPPNCTKEMQRDCEETSLRFYVGSPFPVVVQSLLTAQSAVGITASDCYRSFVLWRVNRHCPGRTSCHSLSSAHATTHRILVDNQFQYAYGSSTRHACEKEPVPSWLLGTRLHTKKNLGGWREMGTV